MARRLVVEADGGSRGNPGVAGYGAVVRSADDGALLAERAAPLGRASNNVAEYSGLIAGLQAVIDLGLAQDAHVEVRLDSKLVVEQMSGRWKIKHADMRRLAVEARALARQIVQSGGSVTYRWVPREANQAADALSNEGMDGQTISRDLIARERVGEASRGTASRAQSTPVGLTTPVPTLPVPGPSAGPGPSVRLGQGRAPLTEMVLSDETTPTLEGSCRLVLVRHGVTDFTESHRLDGRGGSNPPLNPTGEQQARRAGEAVKVLLDRSDPAPMTVLTSSLARAIQTGGAVAQALGVHPEVDTDWDEQGFGDWDGLTVEQLVTEAGDDLVRLREDADYARPGGESRSELVERVGMAFARAVARGGTVVVATHRMPIMCVLAQVLGIDHERAWSLATGPASLTALEVWADGAVQIAFVNDTHHLQDLS